MIGWFSTPAGGARWCRLGWCGFWHVRPSLSGGISVSCRHLSSMRVLPFYGMTFERRMHYNANNVL